ncbi:MAG: hypothetical protein GYA24_10480 [Candidatus Lokiarchaeota archaeon]|nr:hypothetical protein [Candidatus Lokiarchaeota archaeon]
MPDPCLAIPPTLPGLERARKIIAEHERLARDNAYLARRILHVAASDPRVEDTAKMMRLARLLDTTAWYHARKARALATELAAASAALASSP